MKKACSIEGCDKTAAYRGWCPMHYQRWRKHGDPLHAAQCHDPAERFETLVVRETHERAPGLGPCWIWQGERNRGGYGRINIGGRRRAAHRWAYEHFVGPFPEGTESDHLCFVHACVNPAHIEPVTHAENLRRRRPFDGVSPPVRRGPQPQLRKTHCKHGHELLEANVYIGKSGSRHCKACHRAWSREHRRRKQAVAA